MVSLMKWALRKGHLFLEVDGDLGKDCALEAEPCWRRAGLISDSHSSPFYTPLPLPGIAPFMRNARSPSRC